MRTFLIARVDGDTYAVPHDGDHAAAIGAALDLALPDPGATVHVALVEASDAGAARLASVGYWIGTDDTDEWTVRDSLRCMDRDPDSEDSDAIVSLSLALVDEIACRALADVCADCGGSTAVGTACPHVCEARP